jgi:hypothetical protein
MTFKYELVTVRTRAGRKQLLILAIMANVFLVMVSFEQSQYGMQAEAPGETKGPPAKKTLSTSREQGMTVRQTKSVIFVRELLGVDCTGEADSEKALNALTGNAPTTNNTITGRTLSFENCPSIRLNKTWVICNQGGFIIDGLTRSGAAGKGVNISWAGAGNGVMIDMEYVDGFQVQGLNVQGNSRAGVGIQIDKNGAGAIWNTTDGRLINNTFQGANQNWIGVSISPVSRENVEDMRIEDSSFYCSAVRATTLAVGIEVGASQNAKNEIVKHINVTGCLYGIWQKNGSIQIRESEFTYNGGKCGSGNGADIRLDSNTDVDIVEGNLDENGTQGINMNGDMPGFGFGHPLIVRGNHAGPAGCENTSNYWFNVSSPGAGYIFEGNSWDPDNNLVKIIGSNQAGGTGNAKIYTIGNYYPNSLFTPWWTLATDSNALDLGLSTDKLLVYGAKTNNEPSLGSNASSPILTFRGYLNGSTSSPDDIALQNIPASGGASSGGTFLVKHQEGATGREFFGWDGSFPGITVSQISTPAQPAISNIGAAGSTSYTYAVVAYAGSRSSVGSSTGTTKTGNATLSRTNYNQLQFYPSAGADKYCIWRISRSGDPSSTGNIGCISAIQARGGGDQWLAFGYTANVGSVTNPYRFNDTGLIGDGAGLPTTNGTGQLISTVSTGTAPFSINSDTPVANLTLFSHPQVYEKGVLTHSEKIYTNTEVLSSGWATHSFANSFTFTSSSTFGCTCTDQTAVNVCKAAPASATSVNLAGTGSDVLWLECLGH